MKIAYYARPLSIYDTPQEDRDKKEIIKLGFMPVEINTEVIQEQALMFGMIIFKAMVVGADALFFRGFVDGSIPAGVGKEIIWAKEAGLPVFELPSQTNRRILDVYDTRAILAELGER